MIKLLPKFSLISNVNKINTCVTNTKIKTSVFWHLKSSAKTSFRSVSEINMNNRPGVPFGLIMSERCGTIAS
jgi:hypothetical protein